MIRRSRRGGNGVGREPLVRTSPPHHLVREPPMAATLVETLDIPICSPQSKSSPARAEASRPNGRRSHGPTSPEGKARSRRNGCNDECRREGGTGPAAVIVAGLREAGRRV